MRDNSALNTSIKNFGFFLRSYLAPYKPQLALMAAGLAATTLMTLAGPALLRDFIDGVVAQQAPDRLVQLAFLFFLARLGRTAGEALTGYVGEGMAWSATNQVRQDLLRHALTLDMDFFNENPPGTMLERTDGDSNQLAYFLSQFSLRFLRSVLLLVGIVIYMAVEDWRVCLIMLGFIAVIAIVITKLRTFGVPYNEKLREAAGRLYGFVEERLSNLEDIKALGGVTRSLRQMEALIEEQVRRGRAAYSLGNLVWPSTLTVTGIGSGIMLAWGGHTFLSGGLTLGTMYLLYAYINLMLWPMEDLSHQMEELQKAGGSIVRIEDLMSRHSRLQYGSGTSLGTPPAGIRFEQVNFHYEDDEIPALRDVSFDVQPGRSLGIAGRTGSGKTTIGRLLARMYDPDAGQVLLNGRNLKELDRETLRRKVGVVTQTVQFFSGSLRENLRLFDEGFTDEDLKSALRKLDLLPWLDSLPDGLDTHMAGSSLDMSTGEAQRLALTRIFLKDPEVVVLDEAVASLDPATEAETESALQGLMAGRTGIVIAHKMRSLENVDEVLILEDGRVQEHGRRAELLARPDSRLNQLVALGEE